LVGLPYVMWSAHFFVTHIQTEKISSWNGLTVHVCCFMLAHASTKTFVSRVRKTAKKIVVSRKIRYQGHSLAGVSLYTALAKAFFSVKYCTNSRYKRKRNSSHNFENARPSLHRFSRNTEMPNSIVCRSHTDFTQIDKMGWKVQAEIHLPPK
jgi:hypothetical protein